MGVVFDEVIATVEAPAAATQAPERAEQLPRHEEEQEKIMQVMETRQRRAKRLWAD